MSAHNDREDISRTQQIDLRRLWRKIVRVCSAPLAPLCVALGLAGTIAYVMLLTRTFAINDGGFWYALSQSLQKSNFVLPRSIIFNADILNVTYPPLAAYLVAAFETLIDPELVDPLLFLPLFFYVLCALAFAAFTFVLYGNTLRYRLAAIFFPLTIHSHAWFVMGGGVSRGLGFLFQLLAWTCALLAASRVVKNSHPSDFFTDSKLGVGPVEPTPPVVSSPGAKASGIAYAMQACAQSYKRIFHNPAGNRSWFYCLLSALCLAGSVCSHPTAAIWTVAGLLYIYISQKNIKALFVCLLAAAFISSPWWLSMLFRFGIEPYLAAFGQGQQSFGILIWLLSPVRSGFESFIVLAAALLGILVCLKRGSWMPVALLGFGMLADPRGLIMNNGVAVTTLLFAEGVAGISLLAEVKFQSEAVMHFAKFVFKPIGAISFLCILYVYLFLATLRDTALYLDSPYQINPSSFEIQALKSVASFVPAKASLIFLSNWFAVGDGLGEWFAVFSKAKVLDLHQMSEWTGRFEHQLKAHFDWINPCCTGDLGRCDAIFNCAANDVKFLVHRGSCEAFRLLAVHQRGCDIGFENDSFSYITCPASAAQSKKQIIRKTMLKSEEVRQNENKKCPWIDE